MTSDDVDQPQRNSDKLTVFPLIFMTAALFMTLRNMPAMAETGMQMIVFNLITVFVFLIPIALVSAELATGWPENGVFHWVEAAFGNQAGFMAVWLQWIQSLFGMTSILAYVGGSLAYVFAPALGSNKYFVTATIILVYWLVTLVNFKGTKQSGMISSVALLAGVITPSILLIIGGLIYVISGDTIHLDYQFTASNMLPSLDDTDSLLLFLSFVFGFAGIEVSASHAREVVNPRKNYPVAVFSAAIIGFVITLGGGLTVAAIIPADQINEINGATEAFNLLCKQFDLPWLIPVIALLISLGAAGQVSTWVVGPAKGIWAAGKTGTLPPWLLTTNECDVPVRLLLLQASCITLVGLLFLFFDDVGSVFLILTSIAVILYSLMYLLMFLAALKLRYSHSETPRAYKVPGGTPGIWITCLLGCLCSLACILIGFIPPGSLPMSIISYELMLSIFCLISIAGGYLLIRMKKSRWKID
ncbi:amino acid transporter [Endozoicomonas sp. OPT23]|uniref:APC family permease n=1 Tax=Endozoicomonas sp. OPT23 TaxID=2072845 RepID=UPI00129BE172|nr:APC family permease [Endozoicomonas sp. OPT23]MRI31660.1 amino acid transporter [Endozoicomonas sp. OPT23]